MLNLLMSSLSVSVEVKMLCFYTPGFLGPVLMPQPAVPVYLRQDLMGLYDSFLWEWSCAGEDC